MSMLVALTTLAFAPLAAALHARSPRWIMLSFVLMVVALGVLTVARSDDSHSANLFVSHFVEGTLLLRGGTEALRPEGGLVQVHPVQNRRRCSAPGGGLRRHRHCCVVVPVHLVQNRRR